MSDPQDPASLLASLPESPDASAMLLARLRAHGARGARYEARGEVARGGMGVILRVWDADLRRDLAMKVVLGEEGNPGTGTVAPKMLGRFLEEAQVTGQLDHPGIVPVHELGLDEHGSVFFTMRLVKGRDLKEVFDRVHTGDAEWPLTRVLWILLKVCDAMAYAHAKGVVHRDLKPANVMVGRFGEVYVMDWGLARILGHPDSHDLRLRRDDFAQSIVESDRRADVSHSADSLLFTMDGDVVGTPAYMAPEQARGEIDRLGPRSDVYALGAMLYHLLTAEMPYIPAGAKASQHAVLRMALEGPPRPLHEIRGDVPEELAAICEKAMARDPEDRYEDMGALGADLRAYLENRVVQAHRRGAWIELVKWVRRNRALATAWSAALLVSLLGLGATLFVQVRERRAADAARLEALASEQRANENRIEAERQRVIAQRERSNVLRLSAFQELDDLEREAAVLWPATPERADEMRAWLARAAELVAGLEPGEDGEPGHRRQLAELAARAHPLAPERRAALVAAHPRGGELAQAEAKLAALEAADQVRRGRRAVPEFDLAPEHVEGSPEEWNERAFALVDPARSRFGREAEGLALARAAVDETSGNERCFALDTLAWALFACGLDEEALRTSRLALAAAPPGAVPDFESHLERSSQAVAVARGPRGAEPIAEARERVVELERVVLGGPQPDFESEDDRWWHGQLVELVRELEGFADPDRGLVDGLSSEHGWGVARRLEFALALEERSLATDDLRLAWERARTRVREASGFELAPQLGLVPLGPDPESGLEEFGELATGELVTRGPGGALRLGPDSGVVFVLVPGGETWLGAQRSSPARENHDPSAQADEGPVHALTLDPFLIAKHELTQAQWLRFTGRTPSKYLAGMQVREVAIEERSPLERVSWFEAQRELERLGWTLPTEAQWEHAARAGTEGPWWTGEEPELLSTGANLSDRFARERGAPWSAFSDELDDGHYAHAPVGSFEANPFGLFDVLGNVYEWCRDDYGSYDLACAPRDGLRLGGNPAARIVRGGSFVSAASGARVAKRDSAPPELENEAIGVRPVRPLDH